MRIGLGIGLNRFRGGQAAGPVNTVAPVISGTAERGEELSSTTGTWTGTGTITYAYQWLRNGAEIAGATASTYTLVAADDNANIRCRVTATDDEGSRSAFSTTLGPVLGAPLNLTAPVLSGTETVGEELSVTNGTWQGVAPISFGYQWKRDGVNIAGATSNTYTLVAADYGAVISCDIPATNSVGTTTAQSNETGAIAGLAPTNDTAPSISGDNSLGDTLTRTAGTWSGVPTPSITGQWRRNGVAIPSETGATYTIVAADSGADIDYLETATNAEGSATQDSNDITVQTFAAPTNDVAPSITGNDPATIDDVLTRVEGTWSGNPTPTLAGEWYRNNVATGETGSTYTVTAADDNSFIFYRETATNAIGSASEDSAAVTVEDFTVPAITGSPTIAGTEEVGETLTATAASVTGNPTPTRTWQWQRSADGVTGWADISGATASTYVLDAGDETNYIRVKQIETNALGSDEAVSVATGQIQAGGATGILDSYTGAAFAFAPDTLIYSGFSVTDNTVGSNTNGDSGEFTLLVRRDSDNALQSFTWEEVSDGTLVTWVGAGNNGFVQVAYDQSGNGNHASQTTAANQPKIVDNGNLVVENGKAAVKAPNPASMATNLTGLSEKSIYCVATPQNSTTISRLLTSYTGGGAIGTEVLFDYIGGNRIRITDGNSSFTLFTSATQSIFFGGRSSVSLHLAVNDGNVQSGGSPDSSVNLINYSIIEDTPFGTTDGESLEFFQFIVLYSSYNGSLHQDITTAINNEYSIY